MLDFAHPHPHSAFGDLGDRQPRTAAAVLNHNRQAHSVGKRLDFGVARTNDDDVRPRRCSQLKAEVEILRHQDHSRLARSGRDGDIDGVRSERFTREDHVRTPRAQHLGGATGDILVEEKSDPGQLAFGVGSFILAAAYRIAASSPSAVRKGNSSRILSCEAPPASNSKRNSTLNRVPRTRGFPPRISASQEISGCSPLMIEIIVHRFGLARTELLRSVSTGQDDSGVCELAETLHWRASAQSRPGFATSSHSSALTGGDS